MTKRKPWVSALAGILAAVLLLTLLLGMLPTPAHALESSSEIRNQINALKKEKEAIQAEIKAIKKQFKENENEIANIVAKKNVIDQEIGLLAAEIININEQIAAFNVLIADKQDELDTAQDRYDELAEKNKERIRAMEEDGSVSYWEVIFNAKDFSDLLDRMNMVEEIAVSDQRRLKELGEAADNVGQAQEALALEKADLQDTKDELDATQGELDAKRQEASDLILELLAKADELMALEEEFEAQEQAFLEEIVQQEQAYNEAKHREWLEWLATSIPPTTKETAPPATTQPSGDTPGTNTSTGTNTGTTGGGTWLRPCSYVALTSPFGTRVSPTTGASSYHQGVDLSAPAGPPIYATRAGQVSVATYGSAAGYYVKINHMDGFSSIYMHMTNYVVSAGQTVAAGQLIGYVGATGVSTGNHLHFGISYNGAYVNPCNYVNLS